MTRGQSLGAVSTIVIVSVLGVSVSSQTLGELARQEEARRKGVKTPTTVVITNDTIHSQPRPAQPATPANPAQPSTPAGAGSQEKSAAAAANEKPKPPVDPKKEEAAWRQRIQAERDALQRSQIFAEALQSRINALTTDFTSRDDPAQRAVIATDRQKALDELDRVKNEIAQHNKAITTIQEDARRAGVPPGWLRP